MLLEQRCQLTVTPKYVIARLVLKRHQRNHPKDLSAAPREVRREHSRRTSVTAQVVVQRADNHARTGVLRAVLRQDRASRMRLRCSNVSFR